MQAYGLTETASVAVTQLPNQTDTETVGSVIPCSELRLVDWAEAGYRNTDKPNPRGEILIGGDNIALGYYKLPDLTRTEFKVIDGVRYFSTGDIGEMHPNGNLKIIDRKKDLVKLSGGEYLSLNKVESVVKLLPVVDNCCVVAQPGKSDCIVLICPNYKKVIDYLAENNKTKRDEIESHLELQKSINEKFYELKKMLDNSPHIISRFLKELTDHCLKQNIHRFEIPTKQIFVKEIWTPDTGLVTDSLKLKRRALEKYYDTEISAVYF